MTSSGHNRPSTIWRWLMKFQNPFMKALLRSPLHPIVSHTFMLIRFRGRKSSQTYITPVQYAGDGELLYVITSEGYTWWKNLRGGAEVEVHLRGASYPGHAETSTDAEVIDAVVRRLYPGLSPERRAKFISGKVAVSIRLNR